MLTPVSLSDYVLQIDSHMDFSTSFDVELVRMHHRTKNDYAVLSTYVAPIEMNDMETKEVRLGPERSDSKSNLPRFA